MLTFPATLKISLAFMRAILTALHNQCTTAHPGRSPVSPLHPVHTSQTAPGLQPDLPSPPTARLSEILLPDAVVFEPATVTLASCRSFFSVANRAMLTLVLLFLCCSYSIGASFSFFFFSVERHWVSCKSIHWTIFSNELSTA